MAALKDLRKRIDSVKATQKITSAMKMVAASKLRRAQEAAESARPYADRMARMVGSLARSATGENAPALLRGTGRDRAHLIVVATSDRGLCGAFNSSIVRAARARIDALEREGREVELLIVGRKGRDQLRRGHGDRILETIEEVGGRRGVAFADASAIADNLARRFAAGEFDVCTLLYNRFRSAVAQVVTPIQLIPLPRETVPEDGADASQDDNDNSGAIHEFEPDEEAILADLLPRNMAVQIFRALLENAASEQGARMMAMDNATRNAGDMIGRLTLTYNRSRQAAITRELIEIVSGAEAL